VVLKFSKELNKSQLANDENLVGTQVRVDLKWSPLMALEITAYVIDSKREY
jgi:hypothetical protein